MTWKDDFLDLVKKILDEDFNNQSDIQGYYNDAKFFNVDDLNSKAFANDQLKDLCKDLQKLPYTSTKPGFEDVENKRDFIEKKFKSELDELRNSLKDRNFNLGQLTKQLSAEGDVTSYNIKKTLQPVIKDYKETAANIKRKLGFD